VETGGLSFFIDECLSPRIAERLCEAGHDAVHPLHTGRRGERDDTVLRRCIDENRIIVTENAADFRALVGQEELHPGLIILPCASREETWRFLMTAIDFLSSKGAVIDVMVNHLLEVDSSGEMALFALPGPGA